MNTRLLSHFVIFGLVAVGIATITARHQGIQANRQSLENGRWRLSYDIDFKAEESSTTAHIALPRESSHVRIDAEPRLITPAMKERTRRLRPSGTRELVVSTRQLGAYRVSAEFEIALLTPGPVTPPMISLTPNHRARYLREEQQLPVKLSAVQTVLRRLPTARSTDEQQLQWLFNYCTRELTRVEPGSTSDSVYGSLVNRSATPLGRARTLVTLCRAAGFPARLVTGFELRQQNLIQPHVWIEVFKGNHWIPFDPECGYARRMPENYLPIRMGGEALIKAPAAKEVHAKYALLRLDPPLKALQADGNHPSQVLNLTRLPVEMHQVLSLLLLLPLGALVTAFFRNVIGVNTFGTFAPALFAVSFIYADFVTGLIVLLAVLGVGLTSRMFLERLRLLMVPRLSIILTIIILFVAFGLSTLDYLRLTTSANAVLLPLVILTILIERCYVTIEEDGVSHAMQLAFGTLLVAGCCYLLLRWEEVGQAILVYPEAHLLTIAAFVAIGRYTGYRLVELWRFRDLTRDDNASPSDSL